MSSSEIQSGPGATSLTDVTQQISLPYHCEFVIVLMVFLNGSIADKRRAYFAVSEKICKSITALNPIYATVCKCTTHTQLLFEIVRVHNRLFMRISRLDMLLSSYQTAISIHVIWKIVIKHLTIVPRLKG